MPFLDKLDTITSIIRERGYLWRNQQEMRESLGFLKNQFVYEYLNYDFFELQRGTNQEKHLHPSMITLSKDPFKMVPIQDHCK